MVNDLEKVKWLLQNKPDVMINTMAANQFRQLVVDVFHILDEEQIDDLYSRYVVGGSL